MTQISGLEKLEVITITEVIKRRLKPAGRPNVIRGVKEDGISHTFKIYAQAIPEDARAYVVGDQSYARCENGPVRVDDCAFMAIQFYK